MDEEPIGSGQENPREGRCGIARIDSLFAAAPATPIERGDADPEAVGAVQDLLSGQGYRGLPGPASPVYGTFGPRTGQAVREFQGLHRLTASGAVDTDTLQRLVSEPAADPRASRPYIGLALGFPCREFHKILCLVAQMEGMGRFGALNLNTDRAGLSFGIIQWAQRPGRLAEILLAFDRAAPEAFARVFGGGDAAVAKGLLAHVRKPNGGVNASTGVTTDAAFDMVDAGWTARFRQAALDQAWQRVQVETALAAFDRSYSRIRRFAAKVSSERGIAFLLDVANQFGDAGLERLYAASVRESFEERDALEAIADLSVERMPDPFQAGVRARRDLFLHTPLLSDELFAEAARA